MAGTEIIHNQLSGAGPEELLAIFMSRMPGGIFELRHERGTPDDQTLWCDGVQVSGPRPTTVNLASDNLKHLRLTVPAVAETDVARVFEYHDGRLTDGSGETARELEATLADVSTMAFIIRAIEQAKRSA